MINIENIQQKGNEWCPPVYPYRFPAIDFNFQNTGTAAASLWKFAVSILSAEIDQTPQLDFTADIKENKLKIIATNNGWGTVHNCIIRINETLLKELFTPIELQFNGDIPSGTDQEVLSLEKNDNNVEHLKILRKNFTSIFHMTNTHPFTTTIQGIRLNPIDISWIGKDTKNDFYEGQEKIQGFDQQGDFILTEAGFFKTNNSRSGGGAYSDITYSVIIDPSKGTHERFYRFRRKIASGDTERFHIMVAAPISCNLRIKFKFFIDESTVIESQEFDISIWNPRNSNWLYPYRDGEHLQRVIKQEEENINKYTRNDDKKMASDYLEKLQQIAEEYPFINQEGSRP